MSAPAANYRTVAWAIVGSLLAGTYAGINSKSQFSIEATGTCGKHKFQKPMLQTLFMFIGEMLNLVCLVAYRWWKQRQQRQQDEREGLIASNSRNSAASGVYSDSYGDSVIAKPPNKPALWVYAALSCFDLSATGLNTVGAVWIDASENQMLRGSMVAFTALFAYLVLKSKPTRGQLWGVFVVVLGLAAVGLCGILRSEYGHQSGGTQASPALALAGILLCLAGSGLNSLQNVVEQKLLQGYDDVHPAEVVGWEGVFGTLLTSFLVLPIAAHVPGSLFSCSFFDLRLTICVLFLLQAIVACLRTLLTPCRSCPRMASLLSSLSRSLWPLVRLAKLLLALLITLAPHIGVMNYTLMQIAAVLTAVHRQLINSCRVVLIWLTGIVIHYGFKWADGGESVDYFSFLEVLGFVFLIYGTHLYGKHANHAAAVDEQADIERAGGYSQLPSSISSKSFNRRSTSVNSSDSELARSG